MKPSINIIARTNGVGLDRDVDLVTHAAEAAGYEVSFSHCRGIKPWAGWFPQKKRFDANIFMERVFSRWLGTAKSNILIPNQERFPERHIPILGKIDHIFCKSQHALEIFEKIHPSCHFSGFTSLDLLDKEEPRTPLGILHLAGRSTLKGTETILELWNKHPDWPPLTLVQCKENAPENVPENVNLLTHYLEDAEITKIYNQHPIHLCPSRSEGWGHYLVEAMSCEAVVITTDAPPMNELVRPNRGTLVRSSHSDPRHLGTNFFVDPEKLETAIQNTLATSKENLRTLGMNARNWMLENDQAFNESLPKLLDKLLKPQPARK